MIFEYYQSRKDQINVDMIVISFLRTHKFSVHYSHITPHAHSPPTTATCNITHLLESSCDDGLIF